MKLRDRKTEKRSKVDSIFHSHALDATVVIFRDEHIKEGWKKIDEKQYSQHIYGILIALLVCFELNAVGLFGDVDSGFPLFRLVHTYVHIIAPVVIALTFNVSESRPV